MEAGANTQRAKTQDGKASAEEDLSMEEILQSIRKIIADDDSEGKQVPAENAKTNGAGSKGEELPGSDVLELTEMVEPDGNVVSMKDAPAAKPAAAPAGDVLSSIDQALGNTEKPAAKPIEKPAEKAMEKTPEPPAPKVAASPAASATAPASPLLSAEAASSATAAFKRLQTAEPETPLSITPAPAFRDGATVEDLVTEMLKPMMKAWLDVNLPAIVERIVEREVRKLTR